MQHWRSARASVVASCVVASLLGSAARANADATPEEQKRAAQLFKEGKALLDAGGVAEACRKLAESEQIHPAGGTLINLAVCHEREGKTASALSEFREARDMAERAHFDERVSLAEERIKALEPRQSKLVIRVTPEADVAGVEVREDGEVVARSAWGVATPVDPGDHVILATAPGKKPRELHVTLPAGASEQTVVIPAWEDEAPVVAAPAPLLTPAPAPAHVELTAPAHFDQAPVHRNRTPAIVVGAIGLGGIAMGSYFGVRAISTHRQSEDVCTTNPCGATSVSFNDSSKTAADISTGAFAVGLVGLGIGTYLWAAGVGSSTIRVEPTVGRGRGTIDLVGAF